MTPCYLSYRTSIYKVKIMTEKMHERFQEFALGGMKVPK